MRLAQFPILQVFVLFPCGFNAGGEDTLTPPPRGTWVQAERGAVSLENPQGVSTLRAGESGRMVAGARPGLDPPAPPGISGQPVAAGHPPAAAETATSGPLVVDWQPDAQTLRVDGEILALQRGVGGTAAGVSADGRFRARRDAQGGLEVVDLLGGRKARRVRDGSWVHHFGGQVLLLDAAGQASLHLPNSRDFRGQAVHTVTGAWDAALPAVAYEPEHNWRMGVNLSPGAGGRLVMGQIHPGSPAFKAGFKTGDELLAVGQVQAPSLEALLEELRKQPRGASVEFQVRRDGKKMLLRAVSGDWE